MIDKLKKIGIIITLAVLLTVFLFSVTSAIYPKPKYESYCKEFPAPMPVYTKPEDCEKEYKNITMPTCSRAIKYTYDSRGCPKTAECDDCYVGFEKANKKYDLILFLVLSISGAIAVLSGLFNKKEDSFWTIINAGAVVGGLASIYIGTIVYYTDMARFLRPLVLFVEILVTVLVTRKAVKKQAII